MSVRSGASDLARVLIGTPFGLYTFGNAASLLGTWMQRISVGWLTWQMTESGTWLGLMAFADLFPALIIGPIAGAAADRWDRIVLMRLTQVGAAVVAALIVASYYLGRLDLWTLFALTALLGVFNSASQPLRMSVVTALVPRGDLGVAVAVNSMTFNIARFTGPAAASLLIVTADIGVAFVLHAVCYVVFFAVLSVLRGGSQDYAPFTGNVVREIGQGLVFLARHPGLAPLMLLVIALGTCLRPVTELLPGFAERVFDAGAPGLAVLSSAIGIGALLGSIASTARGRTTLGNIITSNVVATLSLLAFAGTEMLWLGAAILVVVGASMTTTGIAAQTIIHLTVPDTMRGRVLSTYGMILRAGPALGALLIGATSDWIGLQLALILPLPVCLAACAFVYVRRKAIGRGIEQD